MEVRVDAERCQGHGNCYAHHPELFAPDDEAFAVFIPPTIASEDVVRAAESAADACPERAITVSLTPMPSHNGMPTPSAQPIGDHHEHAKR
jgi:ferredoxin